MALRSTVLELAILGLATTPIHGYKIRKRLIFYKGAVGTVSPGVLYPMLSSLTERGLLKCITPDLSADVIRSRRHRIDYETSAEGRAYLAENIAKIPGNNENFGLQLTLMPDLPAWSRRQMIDARVTFIKEYHERLSGYLDYLTEGQDTPLGRYLTMRLKQLEEQLVYLKDFT